MQFVLVYISDVYQSLVNIFRRQCVYTSMNECLCHKNKDRKPTKLKKNNEVISVAPDVEEGQFRHTLFSVHITEFSTKLMRDDLQCMKIIWWM